MEITKQEAMGIVQEWQETSEPMPIRLELFRSGKLFVTLAVALLITSTNELGVFGPKGSFALFVELPDKAAYTFGRVEEQELLSDQIKRCPICKHLAEIRTPVLHIQTEVGDWLIYAAVPGVWSVEEAEDYLRACIS